MQSGSKGEIMDNSCFYVLSFDSTSHAIQTEKRIKEYFEITTIPTPREISRNCGLSIKVLSSDLEKIKTFILQLVVPCSLYRLSGHKTDQGREVYEILSHK